MADNPHLSTLRKRHRDLDTRIQQELSHPGSSDVAISQMKREKLRLKEQITSLEAQ